MYKYWPTKKLGEICQIRTGKKDVDEGNPNGKYPFFSCSRQITYSDTYSFDTEAILVAGNGDVGNTKIYKGKFEAYQRTYVLDKFEENIKYIYYYLIAKLKQILVRSKSGSTMPYIRKGDLESFEISYPEDKEEQQKIVYVLDSIQEVVKVQEKIIEKTKELKKSLLNEIFNPKVKNQTPKLKFKIQKWEKLKSITEIIMGQSPPSSSYNINHDGLPFLQGSAEFSDKYPIPIKWCNKPLKIAEPGDILLSVRAPVGDLNIADQKYCIGRGLAAIRPSSEVDIFVLFNYFQTIKSNLIGFGSTFQAISRRDLENINVPIFDNQRDIANIFQTIDQKIEIEQKKKALYEELFKSTLNQLMTGRLSVKNLNL